MDRPAAARPSAALTLTRWRLLTGDTNCSPVILTWRRNRQLWTVADSSSADGDADVSHRTEADGLSMPESARAAVRDDDEEHGRADEVDAAAAWVTMNFREALDRLGRA
ncbi:hypothetical protein GCM10023201_33520 [Actinomycetospora corticicola]